MSVRIVIVDGAIPGQDAEPAAELAPGAGAVIEFRGVVRPLEAGEPIDALEYEIYEPMAQQELERIAHATAQRHGLLAVQLWHSRGRVAAGACSLRIVIASERRKAAIAAIDELVDELKRDVPIWKRACAAAGTGRSGHDRFETR